jgi:hypothetical protein
MMIMRILPLLLLNLCRLSPTHAAEHEAGLPPLTFEIWSNSDGDMRDILVEMLQISRAHLKEHFSEAFTATNWEGYFGDLELSVRDFEEGEHQLMKITYNGVAFFDSDPVPEKAAIVDLVTKSFKGDSRSHFVDSILMSSDDFLSNIKYLVVSVDGIVVANEDLSHNVSKKNPPFSLTDHYNYVALAGASVCFLIAAAMLIHTCRLKKNTSIVELEDDILMREKNTDEMDIESKSTKSPSPDHSLISQESSKFTYNPRGLLEESTIPSHFSTLQIEVRSLNVEARQNNMISPITPAPFAADISVIGPDDKEMSIIEEESSAAESSSGYLSRSSLHFLNQSTNSAKKKPCRYSMSTDNSNVLSEISLDDDEGIDVINDLKNLSLQIQQQRTS